MADLRGARQIDAAAKEMGGKAGNMAAKAKGMKRRPAADAISGDRSRQVLYTCSYVPEELILAAGMLPVRLIRPGGSSAAAGHLYPKTCGYVKSLLAGALENPPVGAAGIVIANSCDAMRRLYDLWQAYIKDPPALFLDIPKKKDAASTAFFASELRRLAGRLEKDLGGQPITPTSLKVAIARSNAARQLMGEVFELQRDPRSAVCGTEVFDLCLAGVQSGPIELGRKLAELLPVLQRRHPPAAGPRLLLTGGIVHESHLIALVEDLGGRVVALDACPGFRHYTGLVDDRLPDPILALSQRYLSRPPCARMDGLEDRIEHLHGLVRSCAAQGILHTMTKFCDPYAYDAPLIAQRFTEIGIPFLLVENDYEWTSLEQVTTRVEAFLETIGQGGA